MRRILLIVAMLLIAAPAMAAVTIGAKQIPAGVAGNTLCSCVEVNYTSDSNGQIRAFALDISVDNNFVIQNIRDFNRGESSTKTKRGYGIFPGKFRDYIDPANPLWTDPNYNPVAPTGDPDANTGLGTKAITVELGSLYLGDTNAPHKTGVLFRLDVIPPAPGASSCTLTITKNTTRGGSTGLVDVDGNPVAVTITGTTVSYPAKCYPCWSPYNFGYGQWTSMWEPNCWCGRYATQTHPYQCYGDADNKAETLTGKYRVYTSDLIRLKTCWAKSASTLKSLGILDICLCTDSDHKLETLTGKYRVYTSDLIRLKTYWAKSASTLKSLGFNPCPVD